MYIPPGYRIKKHLIDAWTENNTKEHLAELLLVATLKYKIEYENAQWLDELATHYRDNQDDDNYGERCRELYDDHREQIKYQRSTLLEKTESKS